MSDLRVDPERPPTSSRKQSRDCSAEVELSALMRQFLSLKYTRCSMQTKSILRDFNKLPSGVQKYLTDEVAQKRLEGATFRDIDREVFPELSCHYSPSYSILYKKYREETAKEFSIK